MVSFWEGKSSLGQAAFENLHQAVCVAVVMDRASFARGPHEDQLFILLAIPCGRLLGRSWTY